MLNWYFRYLGQRFWLGLMLILLAYTSNALSITLFHYDLSSGQQVQITQIK